MNRSELKGKKFNKLTVIKFYDIDKQRNSRWLCKCECGNETVVRGYSLKNGHTKSCGCSKHERKSKSKKSKSEKEYRKKLYTLWYSMKRRCEDPNHKSYEQYGGRGVKVCDEWHDAETFYKWCCNNGHKVGLELDRIDNDGNYEPGNCRFVTRRENSLNTRSNIIVEYKGKTQTMIEWAEELGFNHETLLSRYHKGDRGDRLFRPLERKYRSKGDVK